MSSEQVNMAGVEQVQIAPTERQTETITPKHLARLGKRAVEFDGFMILGEVHSPYDYVREVLEANVVDQPAAIEAIVEAIERTDVRPENDHRPVANLAFLGPTGVGKSETAKVLSSVLGGNTAQLIKIDCSNYSNGHEVLALLGSPPSYVGHDQEPLLSADRVENPGTVVLFDEIEKGSPRLYNLMLQIMGDGQLTLNNGESVSFRETVIVLTSNLGAQEMATQLKPVSLGFADKGRAKDKNTLEQVARGSFTEFFTPEFVNRLDKMVVFHPLGEQALAKVLEVKLEKLNDEYEREFGVRLSLSDATKAELVGIAANEPQNGARPLVRALESNIQSTFGRYHSSGIVREGVHVRVVHQTELPESRRPHSDSPFVFMAKVDPSIRKEQRPIAALPAAQEAEPEPEPEPELTDEE